MSFVTGPVAVVAGATVQLKPPQSGGHLLAAVVIANLSPYAQTLVIGSQQISLNPWTEQIYDISHANSQPIACTATNPLGTTPGAGVSAQITATWYGPEEVPRGGWPVSLAANALAANAQIVPVYLFDLLANQILPGVNPAVTANLDVSKYTAIVVLAATPVGQVGVMKIEQGVSAAGVFTAIETQYYTSTGGVIDIVSVINWPAVRITLPVGGFASINVYGSTRPTSTTHWLGDKTEPRVFTNNLAIGVGVLTALDAADSLENSTVFNGSTYYSFFSTQVGNFYCIFVDDTGATRQFLIGTIAAINTTIFGVVAHPLARVRWGFQPSGVITAIGGTSLTLAAMNVS